MTDVPFGYDLKARSDKMTLYDLRGHFIARIEHPDDYAIIKEAIQKALVDITEQQRKRFAEETTGVSV